MLPAQFNPREKKLFFIVITLVFALFLHFMLIQPMVERLSKLRDAIRIQSVQLAKYTKVLNSQEMIQNLYQKYFGVLKASSSGQEEVSKFLQEVDNLCQTSDVNIVDMKPLPIKEEATFKKMRIEIEVSASQFNFGKFLLELKISNSMIHIDSMNVTAASRGNELKCHFILSRIVV